MNHYVIDTNVIATANGFADHLDLSCKDKCINFLLETYKNESIISMDSTNLIFDEYFRYANRDGQPNFGDTFVKWIYDNQCNKNICEQVSITALNIDKTEFKEIPIDSGLERFDSSDKKFIAVALKSKNNPEICNASDSDWFNYKTVITNIGVKLKFILD